MYNIVLRWADLAGYHNPSRLAKRNERFTPHCFRHWFTTNLIRNGMPRDYIKELRGDTRNKEVIDIYNHIDKEDLKKVYLETIPRLLPSKKE